jgi:purine-binding chemotaxis protein CheW
MATPSHTLSKEHKHLTFFLNEVEYGLEILKVREIISATEITPLPDSPAFMKGVINLRGTIIPIINLRMRFGMPEMEINSKTCIIVVEKMFDHGAMIPIGLLVDEVSRVANISPESLGNYHNENIKQDYITGISKDEEGHNRILLNIDRVLQEQEAAIRQATSN